MTQQLVEQFASGDLDPRLAWYCAPPSCSVVDSKLVITTAENTDYWQRTHYGFVADNGHFLAAQRVAGDFVLSTKVTFHYVHQYDQAGLMVRLGPQDWIKTSVEHEPGVAANRLGAVVTNGGYSDWSTCDLPAEVRTIELRIRREGSDYLVEARWAPPPPSQAPQQPLQQQGAGCGGGGAGSGAGGSSGAGIGVGSANGGCAGGWMQLRMAHLASDQGQGIAAGLYACSPKGAGFRAEFEHLTIEPGRVT